MVYNPYQSALQVDPQKEKDILLKLKQDPQKMAELGLDPAEDFSALKSNPAKYNKVISYVKGEAYKGSPYEEVSTGIDQSSFTANRLGDYKATPSAYKATIAPKLEEKAGVAPARQQHQTLSEQAFTAPYTVREQVAKKGGYDIEGLKAAQDQAVNEYLSAREAYASGQMNKEEYMRVVSKLSTSARSLVGGQTGLETETNKALGYFKEMETRAKNKFDNAKNAYETALAAEEAGYTDARNEKIKAAEDMYKASKEVLDTYKKEQKDYQEKVKNSIYNPDTGLYEKKPSTNGADKEEAEIKAFQKDASDVIMKLDDPDPTKRISWGAAFDSLKAKYPKATDETINAILGGGVKYNPQSNTFDANTAWGRAKR